MLITLSVKKIVMIGDRLYTDIEMATNSSIDSILVLSGDTSREEVENKPQDPTYALREMFFIKH